MKKTRTPPSFRLAGAALPSGCAAVYVPANLANSRTASRSYLFGGGLVLRPDLLRNRDQ